MKMSPKLDRNLRNASMASGDAKDTHTHSEQRVYPSSPSPSHSLSLTSFSCLFRMKAEVLKEYNLPRIQGVTASLHFTANSINKQDGLSHPRNKFLPFSSSPLSPSLSLSPSSLLPSHTVVDELHGHPQLLRQLHTERA